MGMVVSVDNSVDQDLAQCLKGGIIPAGEKSSTPEKYIFLIAYSICRILSLELLS